jgi:hypothetical protein
MNLLADLATDRASCDASRPLIFVAHSLGGLVCKEAILLSRNNPETHLQTIFNCTKGILFMGTPHRGAWMADWARTPASVLNLAVPTNKSLLEILETDGQFLESIQVRFWSMIRELWQAGRRLEVTCVFEELPLPVVGRVVSKESATLEGYNSFSIHANHRDMVRFGSAEEGGFKRLLGELMRWESQVSDSPTSQQNGSMGGGAAQIDKAADLFFNACGSGIQFNAPWGIQNNNTGSGTQFTGTTFHGPVRFGNNPPC